MLRHHILLAGLIGWAGMFAAHGASPDADNSNNADPPENHSVPDAITPSQTDAKEAEAQKLKAALRRLSHHPRQQAELTLSFDARTDVLTIALKNARKVPIKVDRELVLLTQILVFDQSGEEIKLKQMDDPTSRPADFSDRFATIQPGGAIQRIVSLREGFTSFHFGRVLPKGGLWQATRFESRAKLSPDAAPARIRVAYESDSDMRDSFRAYSGFDMQAVGLFDGPLVKEIQIAARSDHAAPTSAPASE